jgi:hypothetical protein
MKIKNEALLADNLVFEPRPYMKRYSIAAKTLPENADMNKQ